MANDDRHGNLSILDVGTPDTTLKPERAFANVTIFGMRLCRMRQTDAEYVESVRKMVSPSKWIAVLHGLSTVLYFATFSFIWYAVSELTSDTFPDESPKDNGLTLALGIGIGAFMGLLLMQAMSSFIQMLTVGQGQRTERLMLKFHDELKSRERGMGATDSDCED